MESPVSFADLNTNKTQEVDGCIPIFHTKTMEDQAETQKTGKRKFKEVPYVQVISPGNDKEVPDFKVTQIHKDRWPVQWEAFQKGVEAPVDGFPLTEWNGCTRIEAHTLCAENIKTVETLVATPDINLQNIGHGFIGLKHRAEGFMESQKGEAGFQKLTAENKELRLQVENNADKIKGLEAVITDLKTDSGKKKSVFKK